MNCYPKTMLHIISINQTTGAVLNLSTKMTIMLFTFQIRCPFHLCPVQSINYLINPLLHPHSLDLNFQNTGRFLPLWNQIDRQSTFETISPSLDCGNQLDQHPSRQFSSSWTKVYKQHRYCSPCYLQSRQTTMSSKAEQSESHSLKSID